MTATEAKQLTDSKQAAKEIRISEETAKKLSQIYYEIEKCAAKGYYHLNYELKVSEPKLLPDIKENIITQLKRDGYGASSLQGNLNIKWD